MTKVQNFVAGLARRGKSAAEIKTIVDAAFGDKALGLTSIYYIMKVTAGQSTDNQRQLNGKKTKRTANIVAAVAADVAEDGGLAARILPPAYGLSIGTIFNILRDDLGLEKKFAR
jgi:hypothetical protein